MKIWVNAQLAPALASWIAENFVVEAIAVRDLGLRDATDQAIFNAARDAAVIVMTKDSDFVDLVNARGSPPQVIWLSCGSTCFSRPRANDPFIGMWRTIPEVQAPSRNLQR